MSPGTRHFKLYIDHEWVDPPYMYIPFMNLQIKAHGAACGIGSSDFDKIFENGYASCSFELAKDI
jgi:hypothetical protein